MNKLMGFYELKHINIPAIPWKRFTPDTRFDPELLWTIRMAVANGNDLNLPRAVGVPADKARECAMELFEKYGSSGLIVYYPYFIAEKSGVMEVNPVRTVIEAVNKDLWNLVTHGNKMITITNSGGEVSYTGDSTFLSSSETDELLRYADIIRNSFRDHLNEGSSILAEWSFAHQSDINNRPVGEKYLVFYELRSLTK